MAANNTRGAYYRRLKPFLKNALIVVALCAFVGALYANKKYDELAETLPSLDKFADAQDRSTRVLDRNGLLIGELGNEMRIPVSYDKISKFVVDALIASEDSDFFKNSGISYKGIARAFIANLRSGGKGQGGSTITQQLVKQFIVGGKKSYERKLKEAILAMRVREKFTPEAVLEMYLNKVNFGFNRNGIEAAANFYFGKTAAELNLSESAMLVAVLPSPTNWSPLKNMTTALAKQKRVLNRMLALGKITSDQHQYALANPPVIVPYKTEEAHTGQEALDAVRKFLETVFSKEEIKYLGLTIWTTIDLKVQAATKAALKENNKKIGGRYMPEGAVVILDAERRIIAMVGGANYAPGGQNRATEAWRQPGSTFKGLVYAAGFEAGKFGPESMISNVETEFTVPGAKSWTPINYRGEASDVPAFSVVDAYAESLNRPASKAICGMWPGSGVEDATEIPLDYCRKYGIVNQTVQLAERAGIKWDPLDPPKGNPSIALGSNGVTPMGMLNAYMSVSYDGRYIEPQLITKIEGERAPALPGREEHSVVSAETMRKMRVLMRAVVEQGTGRRAFGKLPETAYGKTGTTNNSTNAWFVGGTDSYWAVVWVGHKSQNTTIGKNATGANTALPVWIVAMNAAYGRESTAVSALRNQRATEEPEEAPEVEETAEGAEKVSSALGSEELVGTGEGVVDETYYDNVEGDGTAVPSAESSASTLTPSAADDIYDNAEGSGTVVPAQ